MKAKLPYLVGVVLGVVIVIAVVLVRMSGQKTVNESQSAEPEKPTVTETVVEPAVDETPKKEELILEEKSAETELEEEIEKEIPLASHVKSVPLRTQDEYDEYWFDEDGDLVKTASWHRYGDNEIRSGEKTILYLTDENGKRTTGDTQFLEELFNSTFQHGLYDGYSDSLFQATTESYERILDGEVDATETFSTEWKYDEQSRLTQLNYKDGEYYTEEGSYTYEEIDGQTTVTYKEWYNDPNLDANPIHRTLTFDEEGRLIKDDSSNGEDGPGYILQYEYSPAGKLMRVEQYSTDGEGGQTSFIREYEYDAQGNKTKEVWDGKEHATFEYDENDNMTKMESYNESGVWEYDGEGRLTGSTVYFNRGLENDPIEECVAAHQYDDRGRRQFISFHAVKDGRTQDVTVEFQYGEKEKLAKIMLNDHVAVTAAYNDRGALENLTYDLKDTYSDDFSYLSKEIKEFVQEAVMELLPDNMKHMRLTPGEEPYTETRLELLQNEIVIEYQ